jgi:CheY-like chemotaxis protein
MLKRSIKNIIQDSQPSSNTNDINFNKTIKILLTNFPASIYFKDKHGHYIWCNTYQLNMAGLSQPEDIQGKTDYELPWYEMADQIVNTDKKVLNSKQMVVIEEHANLFNGKKVAFLTKKIPWFKDSNDKELEGIAGISIEISDSEYKENELILQFIRNIQNDMRKPALELIHALSILFEEEKKSFKKKIIQSALKAAKEIMNLLNTTLNCDCHSCILEHEQWRKNESHEKMKNKNSAKRQKNNKSSKKESQKTSTQFKTKPKILLVEDSPLAQRITTSLLLDLHCDVNPCDTAEQALKKIETTNYDMIFIDLGLPDMNGVNLAKTIRKFEKSQNKSSTPIIGQSAQTNNKNKKACLNAGMQNLLPKPLTIPVIVKLLNDYVVDYAIHYPYIKSLSRKRIHNEQVIDKLLFDKITNNNPETEQTFIHLTKQALQTDVPELKKAHAKKDWKRMRFTVHKLRGSFACIAAMRLEKIFGHIEEYLNEKKEPSVKEIQPLYDSALTEIERLKKEIDLQLKRIE